MRLETGRTHQIRVHLATQSTCTVIGRSRLRRARPRPRAPVPACRAPRVPAPDHGRAGRDGVAAPPELEAALDRARRRNGGHALLPWACFCHPTRRQTLRGGAGPEPVLLGAAGCSDQNREGGWTRTVVSMKDLLEAGVHFGHQTRRWNPKMKPYIFTERNGSTSSISSARSGLSTSPTAFVRNVTARKGHVLFIGTKKQAQDPSRRRPRAPAAVRQAALARRHAHQLAHHPQAGRAADEARRPEDEGRWSCSRRRSPEARGELKKLQANLGGSAT